MKRVIVIGGAVLALVLVLALFALPRFASSPPDEMASGEPDIPVGTAMPPRAVEGERANTPPLPAPPPPPPPPPPRDGAEPESAPMPEPVIVMEAPEPFGEDETHRDVSIFIATNRTINPEPDADEAADILTDEIGTLHYATATVSIPRVHQLGHLESQNWFAAQIFSPDEEKHVILQQVDLWNRDDVLRFMDDDLANAADNARGGKSIMMYVHGFNTSFDKAARRAGQLTYDLTWDGPSVLFSWPSQGFALDYFKDSTNAEDSVPAMKQVLRDLAERDAERVIIIAHSMGTRIISNAMKELVLANDPLVNEVDMVILAAPDINARTFREQIAPRFREAQLPVTLYASAEDSALKASKRANGFRRIGDTTDGVPLVDGIDVVDATGAVSDFFGHTYFGDNTSILSDIYQMVHNNPDPLMRPTLISVPPTPTPETPITHWQINLGR